MSGINSISSRINVTSNLLHIKNLCDECAAKLCLPDDLCLCSCHDAEQIISGQWIEKIQEKKLLYKSWAKPGVIHASSIHNSSRILCLQYLGLATEEVKLPNSRFMQSGTDAHERWRQALDKSGLLVSAEKYVNVAGLDFNLRGKLDFVIRNIPKKRNDLIELKTTGANNWNKMIKPDDAHVVQWSIYSKQEQLPYGYIIVEDRDTLRSKYFPIQMENDDVLVYSPDCVLQMTYKNLIFQQYQKARFAIWCADNDKFPAEKCDECIKWGCKQDKCKEFVVSKELVSFDDWNEKILHGNALV